MYSTIWTYFTMWCRHLQIPTTTNGLGKFFVKMQHAVVWSVHKTYNMYKEASPAWSLLGLTVDEQGVHTGRTNCPHFSVTEIILACVTVTLITRWLYLQGDWTVMSYDNSYRSVTHLVTVTCACQASHCRPTQTVTQTHQVDRLLQDTTQEKHL